MSLYLEPFLKWAGGKRWFAENYLEDFLPPEFNRYIEPFLGSGAVFFRLNPKKAILNDLNSDLINTYKVVKQDWKRVERILKKHHSLHSDEYYYHLRELSPRNEYTQAARFIYLNRTCFNGLYRVNLKGKFNVPKGTKDNVILGTDDFESVSKRLQKAQLVNKDFEEVINLAEDGDLLFVDPPYTVKHNENGFVKYNEKIFSWEDQIRLKDALLRARDRNVHIVCTNANHKSIRSLFKNEFSLKSLERASVMSGQSKHRGVTNELIITQ